MHSHILPGMDDGCKTVEQSVQALRLSYRQGVRWLFATPHYYPIESVDAFLDRRQKAWEQLCSHLHRIAAVDVPEICLGAEVAYRPGISSVPGIERLCLGKSSYLLLELPFRAWGEEELRQIRNFSCALGITPVLAHYERYRTLQKKQMLAEMARQEVLVQMNGEALLGFWSGRKSRKAIAQGRVQLLGSDCHNLESRKPNLQEAAAALNQHGQGADLMRLMANGRELFTLAKNGK